jgi:hypothetical protein
VTFSCIAPQRQHKTHFRSLQLRFYSLPPKQCSSVGEVALLDTQRHSYTHTHTHTTFTYIHIRTLHSLPPKECSSVGNVASFCAGSNATARPDETVCAGETCLGRWCERSCDVHLCCSLAGASALVTFICIFFNFTP